MNSSGVSKLLALLGLDLSILLIAGTAQSAIAQDLGVDSDRHSEVLFTGAVQVLPRKQYVRSFTTRSNYKNARIAGNLQAKGGTGNDIRVMVLKGQSVVFDSGQRRSVVLSVDFSEPAQYTLVFDNTFSLGSPKVVFGTVSLVHWGLDVERDKTDRDEDTAHYRQASGIIQKLYVALKADERVLGTTQLVAMPSIRLNGDESINATANWATNGIQVNKGLFRLTDQAGEKGEDVLAATLAHELSHIFYRHPGYGSSGQGVKGLFDELRGVTALDRVQEKEADILGIRVACQAGFDPQGMLILMRVFAQTETRANSFMTNHPSAIERRNYLEGEAASCSTRQGAEHSTTTTTGPTLTTRQDSLYAIFNTSMGTITAKLFENETPITVKNFVALAGGTKPWKDPNTGAMVAKPLYNGITFHRAIPNFMIQTGDPTGTGSHDCGFTIEDEIVPTLKFDQPGRLAMANRGAPNTGACQIFITEVPYPSLDGGYTVFGQVVEGQGLVDRIARAPHDEHNKPFVPVKLIGITIKRMVGEN
jgi:cyclophilin family peptidyl-prolyl cis-trans isomerase